MKVRNALLLASVTSAFLSAQAQTNRNDGVQAAWTRHHNSGAMRDAFVLTIAVTASGQHFVLAGFQQSGANGFDYFVARYSSFGKRLWAVSYDGPSHGADKIAAMQVDATGNIYVTGSSQSASSREDYATVKFDMNGKMLWSASHNGAANGVDTPTALALDQVGNVYVTGKSLGLGTNYDFLTIKYDANGTQKWAARYNGPGNGEGGATAIAIDTAFVYVTGTAEGLNGSIDITTLKYDHDGTRVWAVQMPGSGQASALALDDSGNVFVAGARPGASKLTDYALIKYDRNGMRQWSQQYHGPNRRNDIATALGVYRGEPSITGVSTGAGNSKSYTTIKYDANGTQKWLAHYTGGGAGNDSVAALAMDQAGNIYLTGASWADSTYDFATLKYDTNGKRQWVARYSDSLDALAKTLTVDSSGYVYVAGRIAGEIALVKYNASGAQRWAIRHEEPGFPIDSPVALMREASKGDGSFYVVGTSKSLRGREDYLAVKYSREGAERWTARYNSPKNYTEQAVAAVVYEGAVYITGTSSSLTDELDRDIITLKLDANGKQEWVARFNSIKNTTEFAAGLAVDAFENVYVIGYSYHIPAPVSNRLVTIKYDPFGKEQWVAYRENGEDATDEPREVAVDEQSNVFVLARSWNPGSNLDHLLIKYDSMGNQVWLTRYNDGRGYQDLPKALALDGLGNIYATGASNAANLNSDIVTVKYDSNGVVQWSADYVSPRNCIDEPSALQVRTISLRTNLYVTGWSYCNDNPPNAEAVTIKYDDTGKQEWVALYNGTEGKPDFASELAVAGDGSVYVAGYTRLAEGANDVFTVKYDAAGAEQWRITYSGMEDSDDHPFGLALVPEENSLLVTARSRRNIASQITTIKYTQTPVAVQERDAEPPEAFVLAQNYPNPFNASTLFRYTLRRAGHVTLEVLALSGQVVATPVQEEKAAGAYTQHWQPRNLPSGVYFYRLRVQSSLTVAQPEWIATRKLVLLK